MIRRQSGAGGGSRGAASPSHRPRPSHSAPRLAFYHRDRRSPEATPSSLLPPHHGQPPPLRPCGAHSLRSPPTAGRLLAVVAASPSHRPSGYVESYLARLFSFRFSASLRRPSLFSILPKRNEPNPNVHLYQTMSVYVAPTSTYDLYTKETPIVPKFQTLLTKVKAHNQNHLQTGVYKNTPKLTLQHR